MQAEYRHFHAVLERELALVEQIREAQDVVRAAVRRRAWADFDRLQESMQRLGGDLAELDRERGLLFENLREGCARGDFPGGTGADFYAVAARLEEPGRSAITGLYRELKFKTRRLRFESENLGNYLSQAQSLVGDFINNTWPDRRGKIYTRQGKPKEADMRSLVLNRHF